MRKRIRILSLHRGPVGEVVRGLIGALACVVVPFLLPATLGAQSVQRQAIPIMVGENVHVSEALSDMPHYENLAAGDPDHPGRAVACSMAHEATVFSLERMFFLQCYATFDNGRTWKPTLRVDTVESSADPAVYYGRGDTVFVTTLTRPVESPESFTQVYRSTDGGRTWDEPTQFRFIDREFVLVDKTDGKHAGNVYIFGNASTQGLDGQRLSTLFLYRSTDGGESFHISTGGAYLDGIGLGGIGTGAVLSDGTILAMYSATKPGRAQSLPPHEQSDGPNAEMRVVTSTDGGDTFNKSVVVASYYADGLRFAGSLVGQMAADIWSEPFKDRVYVVWPAVVKDRIQVQFSYSVDKGKTWSKPVVVNDDRNPAEAGVGPDHLLPTVAVNRDGVVVVSWYDRRESRDNFGWRVRAAASLDGGETFSASVPVSSVENAYTASVPWDLFVIDRATSSSTISLFALIHEFFVGGGHTSGMAVTADGTFLPTWVDNRTGVSQYWTAPLTVNGKAVKHGSPELSALDEITDNVELQVLSRRFDQNSGKLALRVRLKNASEDTLAGPVHVRLLTLESALGLPEVTDSDNSERGTGAIWSFSSTLTDGMLLPDSTGMEREINFRVSDLRPWKQGRDFDGGVLSADLRVYGTLTGEERRPPTPASW